MNIVLSKEEAALYAAILRSTATRCREIGTAADGLDQLAMFLTPQPETPESSRASHSS